MAIVTDRLNASKPPTPVPDPKSGKLAPGAINNNKDLDVEVKKEEPSFFGSFFSKNQPKKKGVAVMEAVSPCTPCHVPRVVLTRVMTAAPGDQAPGCAQRA